MTKKEMEAEEKRKHAVLAKAGEQALGIKSESEFKQTKGNKYIETSKLD